MRLAPIIADVLYARPPPFNCDIAFPFFAGREKREAPHALTYEASAISQLTPELLRVTRCIMENTPTKYNSQAKSHTVETFFKSREPLPLTGRFVAEAWAEKFGIDRKALMVLFKRLNIRSLPVGATNVVVVEWFWEDVEKAWSLESCPKEQTVKEQSSKKNRAGTGSRSR